MVNADSLGIADGFADRFQSHHDIFVPIIEAGIDEKLLKVSANVSLRILWPVASRSRTKSVTRVSLTWLACVPSSRSLDFTRGFGGVAASSRRAAAQHTLLAIVQRRPALRHAPAPAHPSSAASKRMRSAPPQASLPSWNSSHPHRGNKIGKFQLELPNLPGTSHPSHTH